MMLVGALERFECPWTGCDALQHGDGLIDCFPLGAKIRQDFEISMWPQSTPHAE